MKIYPSKLVEIAVNELAKLPGIGRKTALRLALFLLKQDVNDVENLANALSDMRKNIKYCKMCNNISDSDICNICSNPKRNHSLVCVVENCVDVMAIENTAQYTGVYHVIGGVISPMDGIGPDDLNIQSFIKRIENENITEVIMALPATIEGDTTIFYLYKLLKDKDVKITVIARGVSIGDELEYADEITLGRSIINRVPYENSLKNSN
ncbi:MAG: recombination protein RecR [Bacteroidales bacterium]|nr:recombination protein RecR [Bacteroidales bacterium]